MNKRAFTLIELLVVIAIIAILAAILFPVFARARSKARQIQCLSGVKQFGASILMYAQDHNERFPYMMMICMNSSGNPVPCRPAGSWNQYGWYWHEQTLPYIKNEQILLCPERGGAMLNPECLPYGYNWHWMGSDWMQTSTQGKYSGAGIKDFDLPAETIGIADGMGRPALASDKYPRGCWVEGGVGRIYAHRINPASLQQPYLTSNRHFNQINVFFLDGHASTMSYSDVNNCNNYWDGRGAAGACRRCASSSYPPTCD